MGACSNAAELCSVQRRWDAQLAQRVFVCDGNDAKTDGWVGVDVDRWTYRGGVMA